jgi:hypothetical protein
MGLNNFIEKFLSSLCGPLSLVTECIYPHGNTEIRCNRGIWKDYQNIKYFFHFRPEDKSNEYGCVSYINQMYVLKLYNFAKQTVY